MHCSVATTVKSTFNWGSDMSKQAVIRAYKNMTSIKTITATYGIPLRQIYAWLDAAGVPRRRKKANRPVNVVDAIKRRAKGETLQAIADRYGVSRQAIFLIVGVKHK